jgi:hypothetical protein
MSVLSGSANAVAANLGAQKPAERRQHIEGSNTWLVRRPEIIADADLLPRGGEGRCELEREANRDVADYEQSITARLYQGKNMRIEPLPIG